MKKLTYFLILYIICVSCDKNHAPLIVDISCNPENRSAGTQFTLTVAATDEDGDKLVYRWTADGGEFPDSVNQVQVKWKSPADGSGKTYTIKVVVADAESEASREFQILLGAPQLGNLVGQVNYTNFKIPVDQATVTVGDKSSTTDTYGHFSISGIVVGDYDLKITKPAYTIFDSKIKITANGTLQVNAEITSVNFTTKLYGTIADQDGLPLENATAVVLNPDGTDSNLKATTNAAGFYKLWYIPFGERTISVKKATTEVNFYVAFRQVLNCQEIETQLDLEMTRLALSGTFTDTRDNHTYPFKMIGDLTWMTENLAYLPEVNPSSKGSGQDAFYYVYGYQGTDPLAAKETDNYKTYGVLYNWPAANKACPSGWHLPAGDLEWDALIKTLGPSAATKMKSSIGWAEHGGGNNSSGFSAIPGGEVKSNGTFAEMDYNAYFWTSSIISGISSYKVLAYGLSDVYSYSGDNRLAFSVRCVKNH